MFDQNFFECDYIFFSKILGEQKVMPSTEAPALLEK